MESKGGNNVSIQCRYMLLYITNMKLQIKWNKLQFIKNNSMLTI